MWVASSQSNSISFEGYTQAHTCMSNVGPGQKLNLQGGWTYIHAFHSSNQSFGTFLTLKILNLHPELNLHPWLIHQCACVCRHPFNNFAFAYVLHFPLDPHRYLVLRDDDPLLPPSNFHCPIPFAVAVEMRSRLSAAAIPDFPHPSTKRIDI